MYRKEDLLKEKQEDWVFLALAAAIGLAFTAELLHWFHIL